MRRPRRTISRFAVRTRIRRAAFDGRSTSAAFRRSSAALTGAGRLILLYAANATTTLAATAAHALHGVRRAVIRGRRSSHSRGGAGSSDFSAS
jgi:hypothetical protein